MGKHFKNCKYQKRFAHHVDHDNNFIQKTNLDKYRFGKEFPKFLGWGRLHAIQIKHTSHGEHAWAEELIDKKPRKSWKYYRKTQYREVPNV